MAPEGPPLFISVFVFDRQYVAFGYFQTSIPSYVSALVPFDQIFGVVVTFLVMISI